MLTDDDLTRELGAAFRAGTTDLTYGGRRRPRRTAIVAVPAVAVGGSIAALAISASLNAGSDPAPAPHAGPTTAASSSAPALVTEKIKVAGYTFTYQRASSDQQAPLVATLASAVPDGLKPIDAPNGAQAWVGKDPRGDNAVYVKVPTEGGHRIFELHSSVWTQDQIVEMFQNGTPQTVPLVKE